MTFSHPDYTIIKELGRGGSAQVYLAVQKSLNRHVAVKVLHSLALLQSSAAPRFLREARTVAKLRHPCIVPVFELGQYGDGDGYYMTMEYLRCGSLLQQRAHFTVHDLFRALQQVVSALAHSHEQGVVHRDVKPDNILFRTAQEALLTDFGIARLTESHTHMTQTGAWMGSASYMSPEQVLGQQVGPASDLYSLGIVLYEMLTGKRPFSGDSAISTGLQHVNATAPPLPDALTALQPTVDWLLQKAPEDRPPSAQAFGIELNKLIETPIVPMNVLLHELPAAKVSPSDSRSASTQTITRAATQAATQRTPATTQVTTQAETQAETQVKKGSATQATTVRLDQPDSTSPGPTRRWIGATSALAAASILAVGVWQYSKTPDSNSSTIGINPDTTTAPQDPIVNTPVEAAENESTTTTTTTLQALETRATEAFDAERWFGDGDDTAISLYQQIQAIDPLNSLASEQMATLENTVLQAVNRALEDDRLDAAAEQLSLLVQYWPQHPQQTELEDRLAAARTERQEAQAEEEERLEAEQKAQDDARIEAQRQAEREAQLKAERESQLAAEREAQQAAELEAEREAERQAQLDAQREAERIAAAAQDAAAAKAEAAARAEMEQSIDELSERVSQWLFDIDAELDGTYEQIDRDVGALLAQYPDNRELQRLQSRTAQRAEQLIARQSDPEPISVDSDDDGNADQFNIPGF